MIKDIISAELLIEKGLITRGKKILNRAKKQAYYYEDFSIVIKTIEQEEKILPLEGGIPSSTKYAELADERKACLDKIENWGQVQSLAERVASIQPQKGYLVGTESQEKILTQPVFENRELCQSKKALERWFHTRVYVFNLLGKDKEYLQATAEYVAFIKEFNYLFEPRVVLEAYSYHLKGLALADEFEQFNNFIEEFDQIPLTQSGFSTKIKMFISARKLQYASLKRDKAFMELAVAETDMFNPKDAMQLPTTLWEFSCLMKMSCYIQLLQFKEALRLYDKWYSRSSNIHISRFMKICKLVLIYELDLQHIMESELESTRKYLAKHPLPKEIQTPILSFFKKAYLHPLEQSELLKLLEQELLSFQNHPEAQIIYKYFNFLEWCLDAMKREKR